MGTPHCSHRLVGKSEYGSELATLQSRLALIVEDGEELLQEPAVRYIVARMEALDDLMRGRCPYCLCNRQQN